MKKSEVNKMTKQEACDYAVKKIVGQGERCMSDEHGDCAYGGPNGTHCAVGWLLDHDDKELMNFEGTLNALIDELPHKVPALVKNNQGLFIHLQSFHDNGARSRKESVRNHLRDNLGIDTSGEHWNQWVEMETGEQYGSID